MAGSSNYCTSIDNYTEKTDGVDVIEADDVNDAYAAVNKIETFIGASNKSQSNNTDILDQMSNTEAPILSYASDTTLSLSAGSVVIKNSGQTNRQLRRKTTATTITSADIDTGALAVNYYYVYVVGDTTTTSFTVKFSLSATAPTGLTNFELVGWFYNNAVGAIDVSSKWIGNGKARRNVPNAVVVYGTDDITTDPGTTYVDLANTTINFYSSGRPCLFQFTAPFNHTDGGSGVAAQIMIDSVAKAQSYVRMSTANYIIGMAIHYMETLSAGTHTIKVQWKRLSNVTAKQLGATDGKRITSVIEL